jgi:hypothetical protein
MSAAPGRDEFFHSLAETHGNAAAYPWRGVSPSTEVKMCHARNSTWTDDRMKQELKERQETQVKRAGLIERLLSGAEKPAPASESEKPPVKETAPAK